eukprot:5582573-Alexandrium_andersonii.AAC.1
MAAGATPPPAQRAARPLTAGFAGGALGTPTPAVAQPPEVGPKSSKTWKYRSTCRRHCCCRATATKAAATRTAKTTARWPRAAEMPMQRGLPRGRTSAERVPVLGGRHKTSGETARNAPH